jgi:hypothetical protein
LVLAVVLVAVFLTMHPTLAIAVVGSLVLGVTIALVIVFAMRERWHGRPF